MRLSLCFATLAFAAASLPAAAQTPITLDQAMANPDWIGPAVESSWWSCANVDFPDAGTPTSTTSAPSGIRITGHHRTAANAEARPR